MEWERDVIVQNPEAYAVYNWKIEDDKGLKVVDLMVSKALV